MNNLDKIILRLENLIKWDEEQYKKGDYNIQVNAWLFIIREIIQELKELRESK